MLQINWTVLVLLIMGHFALAGFFKGWWKEAITTIFLAVLVFFLQMPSAAQFFINSINWVIAAIWQILPSFVLDFLATVFGLGTAGSPPQIDASSPQTWLIMLIVFVGLAILFGRLSMPGSGRRGDYSGYVVTCGGGLFGVLLGAVNGWLIISLIRAYLDGRNLPAGSEMASIGMASPVADQIAIQAVNVPNASILDSFLPWLFVGISLAVLVAAFKSRVAVRENKGFRKIDFRPPPGYAKTKITKGS
ncbi:MAG: hypothetical protein JW953_23540 [Anaerolineae bacterium]|nr:hypothetical protein [Anaerolineae bacterium]